MIMLFKLSDGNDKCTRMLKVTDKATLRVPEDPAFSTRDQLIF